MATGDNFDRELLGRNVRHWRHAFGWTQEELAVKSGVNKWSVLRAEKGTPVRMSTLLKICTGLNVHFDEISSLDRTQRVMQQNSYVHHQAKDYVWFDFLDRRHNIPPTKRADIQKEEERQRLGRLGFVPMFRAIPSFLMPNGPNMLLIEIHGRYESGGAAQNYEDCLAYNIRGDLLVTVEGKKLVFSEGDMIGYGSNVPMVIEPTHSLGPDELPPLVLWVGANRKGLPSFAKNGR